MRISDWSSDVCSSDLPDHVALERQAGQSATIVHNQKHAHPLSGQQPSGIRDASASRNCDESLALHTENVLNAHFWSPFQKVEGRETACWRRCPWMPRRLATSRFWWSVYKAGVSVAPTRPGGRGVGRESARQC